MFRYTIMPPKNGQTAHPLTRWTLPALLASAVLAGGIWVVPMPLDPPPVETLLTDGETTGLSPSEERRRAASQPDERASSSDPITYPDADWSALASSVTGVFDIPPYPPPPEVKPTTVVASVDEPDEPTRPVIPIYWTYAGIMTAENASNRAVVTIAGVQRIVGINDEISTPELTDGSMVRIVDITPEAVIVLVGNEQETREIKRNQNAQPATQAKPIPLSPTDRTNRRAIQRRGTTTRGGA